MTTRPDARAIPSASLCDAVVVGSGPNGLAAAVTLAMAGWSVHVHEAEETVGGGTRTDEGTLPGFRHDVCSGVHPLGFLSPLLSRLPLQRHGLEWLHPQVSVAHPLADGRAVILEKAVERTAAGLGRDASSYTRLIAPFLRKPETLIKDVLAPAGIPADPVTMARFAWYGLRSARSLARHFEDAPARALLAGCAAHSILPLERALSGGVGLVFAISGHLVDWPVARGGSQAITDALAAHLRALGGEIVTRRRVTSMHDLPKARAYLFDVSPKQVAEIAGDALPSGYRRRLLNYRYGPGAFKLDWALDGPIPWKAPECGLASTVHVGGTFDEIATAEDAVWRGTHPERPFVLVCQQSHVDSSRAPAGKHTGYAYCHVPSGSSVDMSEQIESQIERFAPGFRQRILARRKTAATDFERYNANYVGGAITGGVADIGQLFTRPVARVNPHTTPNRSIYLCSASTPPGGGVHGMCGYYAARSALRRHGLHDSPELITARELMQ
jgi:phytoene dehydrogenase-like protein